VTSSNAPAKEFGEWSFVQFVWNYEIKETDLDFYGHVNNANYVRIFEMARWEIVTPRGGGLDRILKERVGPVILDIKIKFQREVTARETVQIKTQLKDLKKKTGLISQAMFKDGASACEAEITFGLFDLKNRKLLDFNDEWLYFLGGNKIKDHK
jgi:YbgC/YbaW family acyl-CoA thioester hydrolase